METFEFDYRTAFNGLVDYLLEPFKCKHCHWYDDSGWCTSIGEEVSGEDFCSKAEKEDVQ